MNNNYLTDTFFYSDEWNSFIKSNKLMMEEYEKIANNMDNILNPIIKHIEEFTKILTSSYTEYIEKYNTLIKKYNTLIKKIVDSSEIHKIIENSLKASSLYISEILREYDWNNIIKNSGLIFNDIDFNQININEDGIIVYQDEEIQLDNKDVENTLNLIQKDISKIREVCTSKKSKIIVVLIYIITGICGGFFNKCGEYLFNVTTNVITNAYNNHIEENKDNTKDSFVINYRIVNANELNVREEASSESRIIGKLYLNQCVQVLEKINYWTKIRYINKEKKINIVGWVFSRYISYIDEATLTLIGE